MSRILTVEKIPANSNPLVETSLTKVLERKSLGQVPIDFLQIENFLSGGKTGAVVFVTRYGKISQEDTLQSAFIRTQNCT